MAVVEHDGRVRLDPEPRHQRLERRRLKDPEVRPVTGIRQVGPPVDELGVRQMRGLELLGALTEIDETHVWIGDVRR